MIKLVIMFFIINFILPESNIDLRVKFHVPFSYSFNNTLRSLKNNEKLFMKTCIYSTGIKYISLFQRLSKFIIKIHI